MLRFLKKKKHPVAQYFEEIKNIYQSSLIEGIQCNVRVLQKLKKARSKTKFSLRNLFLDTYQLQALEGVFTHQAVMAQWRTIVLKNNPQLGLDGCKIIARVLRMNEHIHKIDMTNCGVTDEGARLIGQAVAVRKVNLVLNLANNPLSMECMKEVVMNCKLGPDSYQHSKDHETKESMDNIHLDTSFETDTTYTHNDDSVSSFNSPEKSLNESVLSQDIASIGSPKNSPLKDSLPIDSKESPSVNQKEKKRSPSRKKHKVKEKSPKKYPSYSSQISKQDYVPKYSSPIAYTGGIARSGSQLRSRSPKGDRPTSPQLKNNSFGPPPDLPKVVSKGSKRKSSPKVSKTSKAKTPEGNDKRKTPEGNDKRKTPEGNDKRKTPEGNDKRESMEQEEAKILKSQTELTNEEIHSETTPPKQHGISGESETADYSNDHSEKDNSSPVPRLELNSIRQIEKIRPSPSHKHDEISNHEDSDYTTPTSPYSTSIHSLSTQRSNPIEDELDELVNDMEPKDCMTVAVSNIDSEREDMQDSYSSSRKLDDSLNSPKISEGIASDNVVATKQEKESKANVNKKKTPKKKKRKWIKPIFKPRPPPKKHESPKILPPPVKRKLTPVKLDPKQREEYKSRPSILLFPDEFQQIPESGPEQTEVSQIVGESPNHNLVSPSNVSLDDTKMKISDENEQLYSLCFSERSLTGIRPDLIPMVAFRTLTCLDLSHNSIEKLPSDFFHQFSSLQILSLKGNLLKDLSGLEECFTLQQLDVSCNQLTNLLFLELLKDLVILDASYNLINSPKGFRMLSMNTNLRVLHTTGNPADIRDPRSLRIVLISLLKDHLTRYNGKLLPQRTFQQRTEARNKHIHQLKHPPLPKPIVQFDLSKRKTLVERYEQQLTFDFSKRKTLVERYEQQLKNQKTLRAKKKVSKNAQPKKSSRESIQRMNSFKRDDIHQSEIQKLTAQMAEIKKRDTLSEILNRASPNHLSIPRSLQPERKEISFTSILDDVDFSYNDTPKIQVSLTGNDTQNPLDETVLDTPRTNQSVQSLNSSARSIFQSLQETANFLKDDPIKSDNPRDSQMLNRVKEDLAATFMGFTSFTELMNSGSHYSEILQLRKLLEDCCVFEDFQISDNQYSKTVSRYVKKANTAKRRLKRLFQSAEQQQIDEGQIAVVSVNLEGNSEP